MNDIFKQTLVLMRHISNSVGENCEYNLNQFSKIKDAIEEIKTTKPFNTKEFWLKVFELSEEEKECLGFIKFDNTDKKMCIPIWIWHLLPNDMLFDGKLKSDLDNDIRFGCVWWKA